jgi:hypothetical protein
MARTTSTNVEKIIEVTAGVDLEPFIETASELVTEHCVSSTDPYTSTRLELIERWLAAHFYAIYEPRVASERAGPVGENKQYKLGLNLAVTTYGQQAMLLDTKGSLAALSAGVEQGKSRKAVVTYLGKTRDDI